MCVQLNAKAVLGVLLSVCFGVPPALTAAMEATVQSAPFLQFVCSQLAECAGKCSSGSDGLAHAVFGAINSVRIMNIYILISFGHIIFAYICLNIPLLMYT